MVDLRPYQVEAKDAVLREWAKGHRKTLLVLPTGTGKTVVFSKVVEEQVCGGGRALILAHRGELLDQAADKLRQSSGLESALEKAEYSSLGSPLPVTVGSVQTLCRPSRLEAFPSDYFTDIIVDEAHHCLSDSYRRVLDHFPDARVLGVTATPDRADQRNLGQFFDSKAYEYSMAKAVRDGWLCKIKALMLPLQIDLRKVHITNGDYNAGEIGGALLNSLEEIASEMERYCKGRRTVVFLPLVSISKIFCGILKKHGFRAEEVDGESPDRSEILHRFESGETEVLCNAMLLTEGWDCPATDCVVILRPTKIRSLYQQMVGRGMRLAPDKDHLLLLDFLWLTEKHDLCRPSALLSKDDAIAKKIDQSVEDTPDGVDLLDAEEQAVRDVIAEREQKLQDELNAMRQRKARLVDPLQYAMSIAAEDLSGYVPTFAWEMGPATERQLAFLEKRGIQPGSVPNMGMASLLIDRLIARQTEGLSTPKQIRCLERYGFRQVGTWTFDAAAKIISRLAANNWKLPRGFRAENYQPKGC